MNKQYTCPRCGKAFEADEAALQAAGGITTCPHCQSRLQIDGDYAYVPIEGKPEIGRDAQPPADDDEEQPPVFLDPHERMKRDAIEYIKTCNAISVPMLAHYFNIDNQKATQLMAELEKDGIVGPYNHGGPRQILIEHNSNLPSGMDQRRTLEDDREQRRLLDQIKEQLGEEPQVRTYGCSCTTVIIALLLIWLLVSLFTGGK